MPRLDNSDEAVIGAYGSIFDPDDPGRTEPVDLCEFCCCAWRGAGIKDVEHPDYRDDVYHCTECGARLIGADN